MQIDEFQTRLRAACDAFVEGLVENRQRYDAALKLLFAEVDGADAPSAEAIGPVVNAEMARLAERLSTACPED